MSGKKITKSLVWLLMGLLVLGLGGFGITNLSGTIRSVGSVGDADIDVNEYYRSLQNDIRAIEAETRTPLSFAQAQSFGVPERTLSRLVSVAALDHETTQLGISIGDTNLRNEILQIQQFQGLDGNFDREAYAFSLDQIGMNETRFEDSIREETARTFVQAAIMSGVNTSQVYTDTLLTYWGEQRDLTWAILGRNDLTGGLPVPTDAELSEYHQENAETYTAPELKDISYAWLSPSMIIDTIEVDEAMLREAYDDRTAEFQRPERRLVERLVFPDTATAEAALAQTTSGATTFEMLVTDRGLDLADVDLGDVTETDLGAASAGVFAAEAGQIAGPFETGLGPALFRINAILSAQSTTFEDATPLLRDELAMDRARRIIDAQINNTDDLLAGGATIEDLAKETEMQLGSIEWHRDISDGIAAYEVFRTSAEGLTEADYPDVIQLEDGSIFAMRLNGIKPPALRPLDEVREQVTDGWRAQTIVNLLREQAQSQLNKLDAGSTFEELGLTPITAADLTRRGFQPETPTEFIETVFDMTLGKSTILNGNGRIFILQLNNVSPPDSEDTDLVQLEEFIKNQAASDMSQDLFQLFADDVRSRVGITLNQEALNAVHANFQ